MRLIDADLLKRNCKCSGKFEDNFKGISLTALAEIIDKQPTAYDADKVAERIADIKEKECTACTYEDCRYCKYFSDCWDGEMSDKLALDKAIEIVRGGIINVSD